MQMRFLFVLITFFASIVSSNISAQTQYENQIIEKIDIVVEDPSSTAEFDTQQIRTRIATKEGGFFSLNDFDADLKNLASQYDKVVPSIEYVDGKLYITLKIWPRPFIRSINWEGNCKIHTTKLVKELAIKPGVVFDRQAFNQAFNKVRAYYIKKGYFESDLNYSVTHDPCTNAIDILVSVSEGPNGKIKKIIFRNFERCEEKELCDMIVTKEYNFLFSLLSDSGVYNEDMIQHDQMTILNYLQNKGYSDAEVKIDVEETKSCERINIIISAFRGEIYTFGDIEISGQCLFTEEQIRNKLTFNHGSPFSPDEVRKSEKNITNMYGRFGYIDAFAEFEPALDPGCNRYNIKIRIDEGDQHRVGLIKVIGNCTTQTKIILHETLLTPGEIFNIEKLQKTEERLNNIGYFKTVNVYNVKSEGLLGAGDCYRDVQIEVEEAQTGSFGAFFGFSSIESAFGGINITERNFNMAGLLDFFQRSPARLRGRGEYLNASLSVGNKSRKYELGWSQPYFNDTPWTVGFDLQNNTNRYTSSEYIINTYGGSVFTYYQVNAFVRTGWHYRLFHSDVSSFPDQYHNNPSLCAAKEAHGMVSALGASWTYDSTDSPSNPRNGMKSAIEGEVAGLGGNFSFFGLAYLNTYYKQLCDDGVLKIRADVRFIVPYGRTNKDMIPLEERLFLGGDNTIRGYRSYRIGPMFKKYVQTGHQDAQGKSIWEWKSDNGEPKGGNSLQLASIEYMHNLAKRVDGFVFLDSGHLSSGNFDFWGRFYTSVGFGARVKVLDSIPPITLAMGFPLNEKNRSQRKNFFIQFGGKF
jgi:outer membrane protein insertion porin family